MMRLFFDIETEVNPDMIPLMPEPIAPGNYKDPDKISAAIKEKKADQISSAPLDADYGMIKCISCAFDENSQPFFRAVGVNRMTERLMLECFWKDFGLCSGFSVGYNIIGFDLPYILRRSMALGVKPSILPSLVKYRSEPTTDLMAILYNWGPAKSMKTVAKLYGIIIEAEGITGADVANLTPEETGKYCISDVRIVQQLYSLMNGVYYKFE